MTDEDHNEEIRVTLDTSAGIIQRLLRWENVHQDTLRTLIHEAATLLVEVQDTHGHNPAIEEWFQRIEAIGFERQNVVRAVVEMDDALRHLFLARQDDEKDY